MATNPYVNWISSTEEQALVRSLTTEFIRYHSIGVMYLPRTLRREDILYNEDTMSQFADASVRLPVYIKDVQGWGGTGDFLSKFGIRVNDTVSLVVSREKFIESMSVLGIERPTEGDLVYLPAPIDALFEIKFVEHEKSQGQFYPLGGLYFFEMRCQLHTYAQEDFATSDTSIDIFETQQAYSQELIFASGSGTFVVGETAYEGMSVPAATATGIVGSWANSTNTLTLTYITGEFSNTGTVRAATSNAVYTLQAAPDRLESPNDPNNDNAYLNDESLDLIDTSEQNAISGR